MPYQGPQGYVPPSFGQDSRRDALSQRNNSNRNGQVHPSYQIQIQQPGATPQAQAQATRYQLPTTDYAQSAFATPPYYAQSPSLHQSPPIQYQQFASRHHQQSYLSPSPQNTNWAQAASNSSPDPLSYYQQPARPQQQQSQPSSGQPLHPQARPHPQPRQWTNPRPSPPFTASAQTNATSSAKSPQLSHQSQQLPQQSAAQQYRFQQPQSPSQLRPSASVSYPPGTIDPRALQPHKSHVETSLKPSVPKSETSMAPKRRKSNDGQAVPVHAAEPRPQQRVKQPAPASSPLAKPVPAQIPLTPPTSTIDYQSVLLALSDEYISAAYSMSGALSAPDVSEEHLDHYHALLSTGMGCLESILRNYHIQDTRKEARIRLRLASLLFEETHNDTEAEEILSKGITICERAKLSDLKYAMHHLLARVWFKGDRPKAAIKSVEKLIVETEKLNLLHWVYTFRFLRVSLGFQMKITLTETLAAVKHLEAIAETGDRNGHISVRLAALAFEALVHLRSRSAEGVDLAQRALAAARTHQFSPEMDALPQVRVLLDFIDLACTLSRFNYEQAAVKMRDMQANMDASSRNPMWHKGATWNLPLCTVSASGADVEADTCSILKNTANRGCVLSLRWLTRGQIFTLGYLLSGFACISRGTATDKRAESFLSEGLKMNKHPLESLAQSVAAASTQHNFQKIFHITQRLYVAFAGCGRSEWDYALRGITKIQKDVKELEFEPEDEISTLISYLEAICNHGLGKLDEALRLYRSPELKPDWGDSLRVGTNSANPVKVLAALNSVWILRFKGKNDQAKTLLDSIEKYCTANHSSKAGTEPVSKAIESAFFILKATEPPDIAPDAIIIKTKQYLQHAVRAAQSTTNNHLLCIVMNLMTDLFFHNIVGDQADKSARAGKSLAMKCQDKLWTAVADRMYGNTLENCGKVKEAEEVRAEARACIEQLPASLQAAFWADVKQEDEMDE